MVQCKILLRLVQQAFVKSDSKTIWNEKKNKKQRNASATTVAIVYYFSILLYVFTVKSNSAGMGFET